MKIKNIIAGIALSATLVGGVLAGVVLNSKVDEASAATNSVTLAGSFNSWSTTAEPLTLSGDYWTIEKTLAVNDTFKIVVNGSDWVGDGDGVSWCSGMGSEGKGQNFKVLTAGTYLIKAAKTIGDYGDKSYGIVFENVVKYTVTKYKVMDSGSPISIESEQVSAGDTYAVPASRYEAGYTFGGWYTTSACTTKYTAKAINANTDIYAKYTSGSWSGTVHVDLKDTWSDAAANYAVLFMDKTTYPSEISGWSAYTTGTSANVKLVNVSYSLPFEPKEMTLVRYNSTYTQSQWNSQKWPTDGNKWGQTPDVSFGEVIRVGTTVVDGKNLAYVGYPKVVRWNPSASDISLGSVKLNGSNHAEYYSTSVTLAANQEFKIQIAPYESGDYTGNYTTHSSLTSNFTGGGSSNIKALVAGTYAFYFDSANNSTYITKVEIAEADEWAQYFLNNVGCDATGRNLPSGWSTCATEYGKLSGAAKDIVYGATASEGGTYVEQAVARYDVAVKNHPSLTKFIVNSGDTPRSAAIANVPSIFRSSESSNTILIVVIFSSIALTSIGGYFFLRHRKEN